MHAIDHLLCPRTLHNLTEHQVAKVRREPIMMSPEEDVDEDRNQNRSLPCER